MVATVICVMRSIIANLAPASERQDHTTSPSASATFVSRAIRVHRNPASRVVTIGRNVPLHRGGMAERIVVTCPTLQARMPAADWHDGQLTCMRKLPVGQGSTRAQRGRQTRGTVLRLSTDNELRRAHLLRSAGCHEPKQLEWPRSRAPGHFQRDQRPPLVPSRRREFHPEPLTDPDLILSHHPARAID